MDSGAPRTCLLKIFDLTHTNVGRKLFALGEGAFGTSRAKFHGAACSRDRHFEQVIAHAAVPPTVILSIFTVGIPNSVTKNYGLDEADLIVESLADLPPDELLARFS